MGDEKSFTEGNRPLKRERFYRTLSKYNFIKNVIPIY